MKKRHALLVGINHYPYLSPYQQLKGCHNDVELMRLTLFEHFGFPAEQMIILLDGQATRNGILAALKALTEQIDQEDIVVVYFSGHGSQMTDREGDEPDGLDETIVPYDSGRMPHANRDISDDEIYLWLLNATSKTTSIVLIFDCCHSGHITRDTFGCLVRRIEADTRPIAELPPSPIPPSATVQLGNARGERRWFSMRDHYVLLSACEDREQSYEILVGDTPPVAHGAMTYFLAQELNHAHGTTTYRDIMEQVSIHVTARISHQNPQIEGAVDRELFGLHDHVPPQFIAVGVRSIDNVMLQGGLAHGLTTGSEYAIYAPMVKEVPTTTPRIGLVRVETVHAVTAQAIILEENAAGIIVAGCRACEEVHSYGNTRLRIEIDGSRGPKDLTDALSAEIEAAPLLQLIRNGELADVRVYLLPSRVFVDELSPLSHLGALSEPVWASVGPDGQLILPVHPANESQGMSRLCDNLERIARYRRILTLRNPYPDPNLESGLTFTIMKLREEEVWIQARPDTDTGKIVIYEQEQVGLQITNHYHRPLYINLIDLGLTSAITVFYPPDGNGERVDPGQSLRLGMRYGERLTFEIPDSFPCLPESGAFEELANTETLVLFATIRPTNFRLLTQPGIMRAAASSLDQLIAFTLCGTTTREVRFSRSSFDQEWIALRQSFVLRRR